MTDTEEWGAFLERILRATARRVGSGDIEGLAVIARVQHLVDETMQPVNVSLWISPDHT